MDILAAQSKDAYVPLAHICTTTQCGRRLGRQSIHNAAGIRRYVERLTSIPGLVELMVFLSYKGVLEVIANNAELAKEEPIRALVVGKAETDPLSFARIILRNPTYIVDKQMVGLFRDVTGRADLENFTAILKGAVSNSDLLAQSDPPLEVLSILDDKIDKCGRTYSYREQTRPTRSGNSKPRDVYHYEGALLDLPEFLRLLFDVGETYYSSYEAKTDRGELEFRKRFNIVMAQLGAVQNVQPDCFEKPRTLREIFERYMALRRPGSEEIN
jgi:hypothetical protein